MTDEPSGAELVRRIEEVVRAVERLSSNLESSYLRKDVYDARHTSLRREIDQQILEVRGDVSDLQEAQKEQARFRRQVLAAVLAGLVLMVVQIVVVLAKVPGGAG